MGDDVVRRGRAEGGGDMRATDHPKIKTKFFVPETQTKQRRVLLFSPVPPMKTGTADYLSLIAAELASTELDRSKISIVVDDNYLPHSVAGLELMGFPVISYRQVSNIVERDELRIYFIANNEYHAYCLESLSACFKRDGGRVVSVIHEPSCFMLMNHLSANRKHTFDDNQMAQAMRHQFGEKAEFVIKSRRADLLPFEMEFLVSVQGLALSKSDQIWTHSEFARLKLQLENQLDWTTPITTSSHPTAPQPTLSASHRIDIKTDGVFRIGMFGWVAPSKRVNPVILAFAWALQTQPNWVREKFELVIVGQLPQKDHYDPVGLAESRGISENVRFYGFVDPEKFDLLVDSCDLILNLRFPSCGETSGTLERALSNGIPVITTEYQAFAELPNSGQLSPFWPREAAQLFGLFCRILRGEAPRAVSSVQKDTLSISDLIYSNMCAE